MARRNRRGFTMIELGLVIAVVAILAVVVIGAGGFIGSSRIAKAFEFVGKLQSGVSTLAGRRGATLEGFAPNACAPELIARQLAPANFDVRDAVLPGWKFECNFSGVDPTQYGITVWTEDVESAVDLEAMTHPNSPGTGGTWLSHCRVMTFLPGLKMVRYGCRI